MSTAENPAPGGPSQNPGLSTPPPPPARSGSPPRRKHTPGRTPAALGAPPPPAAAPLGGRRRRFRLSWRAGLSLGLLVIAALVAETAWFAPLDTRTGDPARSPPPLPLAAVNPLGAHVFLEREVDRFKREKTNELLATAGLGWIRQEFPWSELEFQKNRYYDDKNDQVSWAKFDEIVRQARARGLQIIARLDRTPDWARRPGPHNFGAPPVQLADFGDFVAEFVRHYNQSADSPGPIHVLQIWNEPNLADEWDNRAPVNAAEYVALLKAAYTRARAVDPDIVILSAPLATTNDDFHQTPAITHNLRETVYLAEMYAAGGGAYFDIASANAFGYNSPPDEPPAPDTYNLRRVELLRAVMEQHGDARKPIWFTEYAWDAPDRDLFPPGDRRIHWGQVSLQQQADYTVGGIRYARAHWAWAGVFVIWYFRQVGDRAPTDADYYFGMVTPDFVPEPIYRAVQALAADLGTAGPGAHGPLSPAVIAGPGWGLRVQHGAPGSRTPDVPLLVAQAADARLALTFRGTDLTLLLAPAAGAAGQPPPRLYVTVDGGTDQVAASLPRDASGRPYIADLQSAAGPPNRGSEPAPTGGRQAAPRRGPDPASTTAVAVPLVVAQGRERVPEVHTVQLQASAAGAAIAGFTVASERSYLAFGLVTTLLLGLLVADILLLRGPSGPRIG